MPNDSARLIASFISSGWLVGQVAGEERARRVVEQPHGGRVAELLVDPREPLLRLLQIAELVRIRRDRRREAAREEVARGRRLALAVEPTDRAEVDHDRAMAAQV